MQFREISGGWIRTRCHFLRRPALMAGEAASALTAASIAVPGAGACAGQYSGNGNTAARSQPVGHVYQRRPGGEGGLDRPCLCLARHLDGVARQDDRDHDLQAARTRGLEHPGQRALDDRKAWSGSPLRQGEVRQFLDAAVTELKLSAGSIERDGIKERIASRLERIEAAYGRRLLRGTGVLATIGSTAPFVGLFGTVWGIMNSFIGISKSQTTNLAVVAPGIAEALLATAFGLAAAIPAVVIYNVFARSIAGYRALLGDASAEVLRLVSRDLERPAGAASPARRGAPLPTAAE